MNRLDRALKMYKSASRRGEPGERKKADDEVEKLSENLRANGLLKTDGGMSGSQRAAKLLLLLGKNHAAEVLRHLGTDEVEDITREMAEISSIGKDEARDIFVDFGVRKQRRLASKGGEHVARGILIRAFGEEKGGAIFKKVVPAAEENPFDFLDNLEFPQILLLLKREPAPVVSVILPFLGSKKSSEILEAMHPDKQLEIVKRIAHMSEVSPDALMSMANALREKIRKQGRLVTEEVDGAEVLAEILRYIEPAREREILDYLDENNPEISEDIKDRLFTLDVIFKIDDKSLQVVLREFSEEEIAIILKGKDDGIRQRFFTSMSERRRRFVEEEGSRLGPMKRSEVDSATKEFVQYLHDLEEDGKLVIQEEDEYLDS